MNGWWLIGGVLLVEGIMPMLFTRQWRQTFEKLLQLRDGQIRFIGLISCLIGLCLMSFHR
ncbi:DUF2065 domain-containing protein [Methylophilus medardicus]|uniref:DUF2065 domain-containing protein n=1 Tax=Methylophilus medardicus TaxID=2588534 RepID=A0A5B8CRX8_9PROT|nr:DUF2065 domain-containing protein [Methylophilus medardicus]QDC44042.1 DUF2065 domain-containing protein [Methylophilus medardicus]QDC49049.1 DUF2065 domain-containing protein [Methylophilus medardicus]QDC52754.1 DUF2065 domain-containing protein [Methylophilus medardicus]